MTVSHAPTQPHTQHKPHVHPSSHPPLLRTVLGLLPEPGIAERAGHAVRVRPRGHLLGVQPEPQLLHALLFFFFWFCVWGVEFGV